MLFDLSKLFVQLLLPRQVNRFYAGLERSGGKLPHPLPQDLPRRPLLRPICRLARIVEQTTSPTDPARLNPLLGTRLHRPPPASGLLWSGVT